MNGVSHELVRGDIVIIPQATFDKRCLIGAVVNLDVCCADDTYSKAVVGDADCSARHTYLGWRGGMQVLPL